MRAFFPSIHHRLIWVSAVKTPDKNKANQIGRGDQLMISIRSPVVARFLLPSAVAAARTTARNLSTRTLRSFSSSPSSFYSTTTATPTPAAANPESPISRYEALVRRGSLSADEHQRNVVNSVLMPLYTTLQSYDPPIQTPHLHTSAHSSFPWWKRVRSFLVCTP
jgi:hypothetical protein